MEQDASKGVGNAALTTGIIGTALGVLGGGLGSILGPWIAGAANPGFYGNNGWGYNQSFEGKIGQLESEIAYLRGENYADKVANEVYRSLEAKIDTNLEKLYGFVIDLDRRTALNAQGLSYENTITNNRIDCCCEKMAMQAQFERQLRELADASIISYINSNFLPGTLKLPITSICPQPTTPTTGA